MYSLHEYEHNERIIRHRAGLMRSITKLAECKITLLNPTRAWEWLDSGHRLFQSPSIRIWYGVCWLVCSRNEFRVTRFFKV